MTCSFRTDVAVFNGVEYPVQNPFQIEISTSEIAKKIALLPLEIVEEGPSPFFSLFKDLLQAKHRVASLQLSDAADFGCSLARNAKQNLSKAFRSFLDLKGAFATKPAIIVGAGPSLEKNGHLLASYSDRALFFAGGHALAKIPFKPHFGVLIDKSPPDFSCPYKDIPLLFQARAHPDLIVNRDLLLIPDSHFPFLNTMSGHQELFDGGWTVGNTMAAIALYFGCDPIICVGMDYSFDENKKYAFDEEKSKRESFDDWIMAVSWMEQFAKENPNTTFLNATEGGKQFWTQCKLEDLKLEKQKIDIQQQIAKVQIQKAPIESWIQNLQNGGDVVHENLLIPLWKVWEGVFARSGNFTEDQMKLHQTLFFNQVILEHVEALR